MHGLVRRKKKQRVSPDNRLISESEEITLATKRDLVKKASFFQAVILADGKKQHPPARDWNKDLEKIATSTKLKDRKIDDRIFDPVEVGGQYLLGIHKPLKTDFMSTIDENASSVTDFLETDDAAASRFAQSSAVLFTKHNHIFAIALGHQHGPRHASVQAFLTKYFPLDPGAHWVIEPFMDKAQLQKLQKAKGLIEFSTNFTTQRDLFVEDEAGEGVVTFAERLANAVGADVEVKIQVTLPAGHRGAASRKGLLSVFRKDLRKTTGSDSNAKVRAVIEEGVEEELNLVAHKLAEEFELPELGSERRQFSNLLAGLQSVSAEMDDRVRQIIEG